MSTYTQELAKRIREQNEIRDIYKERQAAAQASYDAALGAFKNGGDVYSLDDSARSMYRNIEAELARKRREEQERLKKEREQMHWLERTGHTLGDFLGQSVGGLMKFGENVVDYFGTMLGADEDWVKRDWTQELYMDKLREGTKGSYLYDGDFGSMVQSSVFGLGNMLPSVALNFVPYVGSALSAGSFMANAAGGSTERALQEGASRGDALLYGSLSGIAEGAIEKISGGIGGLGKGIVQSVGKSAGKSAVAKGVLGTAKKYAGRMLGEGLEEVASDALDPLLRAAYTGKVDYSDVSAGSLAETFGVGAMTSGLMLGGQAAAHNATAANRVRTRLAELNEIKAGLDERYYKGKLTEAQYRQGLEDVNWLAGKAVKTLSGISENRAEKVVKRVGEARLENAGIERAEGGFRVNTANPGEYNYKAMTPSLANKVDRLAFKPTSAELAPEQESLVKEYGKLNNGKAGIVFTDEIGAVTEDGRTASANGAYSDGVIYISRSAAQPIREVMKHEFTHALEGSRAYGEYAEFVLNEIRSSATLQKEYGDIVRELTDTAAQYEGVADGKSDILSEVVAGYTERIFSDEKAVARLARANKGLARKALGMISDRLTALGKGKVNAETRRFLLRAESLYRKAIAAKPSRAIALNGNTANEKENTPKIAENSNILNPANIATNTENPSKIEGNFKNDNENSKIIGKKSTIQYAIKNVDKSKLNFEENENIVREMKPVTSIKSNVFQKGNTKLTDMVARYFDSLGNNVYNDELGDVQLNKSGIKDSMAHGIGALKSSAFKAVPRVIEKGKILDYQENWKNRGKDTVVLSAPILIDGVQFYMGVILLRDNSRDFQRFYLHEISLNKKEVNPFKTAAAAGRTDSERSGLTSNNSISDSDTNVNDSAENSLRNQNNINDNAQSANESGKPNGGIKDIKFSLSDSEGTPISQAQAEFFKDSEVRDGDGKLLAVYHGTPYGKFYKFAGEHLYFFSIKKDFAAKYAEMKAHDEELDTEPTIVKAYLNAKKLFDINNKRDFEFLKNNLPDKIGYGFGGLVFDKNEYLELLKGNKDVLPIWSKEQIKNAVFGKQIGKTGRDGHSDDVFVGIDSQNNVVYVDRHSGKYLKYLSAAEVKKLRDGESVKAKYYKNHTYGNEISEAEYSLLNADEAFYYAPKYEAIMPQKAAQGITHHKGQDNWTYVELSLIDNGGNGNLETLIDVLKRAGYDGIKITENGVENYAVYNSNQIKLTTNKTPTRKGDIRFSLTRDSKKAKKSEELALSAEEIVTAVNSIKDIKYSLKANKVQKKVYTRKDADAMVRGVIKLISDTETVKIRNEKEISDEFYRNINSGMDEGAAAVIVSERIVDAAYTEHYDPTIVEHAGDVIEFYKERVAKRFNLDSINAELKEQFGGSIAAIKRVAHNAGGLDVTKISEMATAMRELGISVDSKATPAEIFTAIYNDYRDAKEIEKGYKQSVKESKTAKERNALVQKLAKAMLFTFDKYGSDTALYKRVKELSDTVESLKSCNRTERAKEKSRADIVDEVRLFKEMAKRGISSAVIKDSVTDMLVKQISRIVTRKDINASNLVAATEVLRSFYTEERIGGDYDITHRESIDKLYSELADIDKRTKDLTAYQLDLADKMIKNIRHYIRTAENITRDGKNVSARELAQKGDDEIRQDEELRNKYKVKNVFIKFFRTLRGIVDPKCVIGMAEGGRKDGVIGMLYDDIKRAETNQLAMQIEFMEPMDSFFKKNKSYAKRLSKSYTIGKTEIKFDDAIAILLMSKRAHASATIDGVDYGGIHYQGGGFSYELDNGKTVYIDVSRSDIEQIEKSLSELDIEYIDILEEFYNKKARKVKKETDYKIIGSTIVVDGEYYYPISRADEMIAKKFGDSRDLINNVQNYENLSFNKHFVKNARNPIKLRGSLDVFTEYAKLMSAYATITEAYKNFSKVMSININAGIPGARIKTLRSTLKETAPFMEKYMDDLMQDIQGMGRQKTSKLLSKLRDGYIKAVLGANVKTVASQWAGVAAAMTYLSPRDMAKGFAMHVTKEEFMEHSKFGKAHIYNQSAVKAEGIEQKIGSVGDFFMRPIGFSDKWMHIGYWQSCRYAVQRMYGHKLGTEENYRLADELYEKVARETQSTNVMSERSALQRHESEIMRTTTMFGADKQKQLSRIVEGSVSYIYAQMRYKEGLISKDELKASRNQLVRSASSFAMSNAIYVAIGLLFNALLLKRDEEGRKWDAEDYAKAFGMGMLESYAGLFPIFTDMYNKVASGYDIEHFSYSMINDLVDSTVGVYKLIENRINGEEVTRADIMKTLRQSFYSVNAFLGMPTKNVAKYAKMIAGLADEGALYKYNSLFYPAKKSDLDAAIEEKNDGLSESIFGVMLTERGFGDMSEASMRKLLELYKAVYKDGINVIPSKAPNKVTWKDTNGEEQEKELKAVDKAVYRANNEAAAKAVENLLKSGNYAALTKKEKAAAIKRIYSYYNAVSKAKVTGIEDIGTQMLLASLLSVKDMAVLMTRNANLAADTYANGKTVPDSKKRKLLKLLNSFGLTFAEKELVRVLLGYSPSNPKTIKQTIRRSKLSSKEKEIFLENYTK